MKNAPDIYFCDPAPHFVELKVVDIAAETRRQARRLSAPDNHHGVVVAAFAGLWGLGVTIAWHADGALLGALACACSILALIGFSVCLHEASHRILFRSRALNESVGLLCGLPVLIPLSAFRTNHRFHHLRRGDHGKPTDETLDFALLRTLPAYGLALLVKSFGFATVLPIIAIRKADTRTRSRTLAEYALLAGLVYLAARHVPRPILWSAWLLPLILTALFSQLRAVAEHGLTAKGNTFTASRTVVSNPVLRRLMCNINYHLEHHLFPHVPWHRLPAVHALLVDDYRRVGASVYGSYREFYADFIRATWRGIRPQTRLIALRRAPVLEQGRSHAWR